MPPPAAWLHRPRHRDLPSVRDPPCMLKAFFVPGTGGGGKRLPVRQSLARRHPAAHSNFTSLRISRIVLAVAFQANRGSRASSC